MRDKHNKKSEDNKKHIDISEKAIELAARVTSQYLKNMGQPAVTRDLLDEACSLVFGRVEMEQMKLNKLRKELLRQLNLFKRHKKKNYVSGIKRAENRIAMAIERYVSQKENIKKGFSLTVQEEDIKNVMKERGIPIGEDFLKRLKTLEANLKNSIKGQDESIAQVVKTIRRNYFNQKRKKPLGVFYFEGPNGVGKSQLAKILAKELFGSPKALIDDLKGTELMMEHEVSKIIGSPPGYVGSERSGLLVSRVKDKPYSVILVDEVDKAHEKALMTFLGMIEDGNVTDQRTQKQIDFSNTIIIFTSNMAKSGKLVSARDGEGIEIKRKRRSDMPWEYISVSEELEKTSEAKTDTSILNYSNDQYHEFVKLLLKNEQDKSEDFKTFLNKIGQQNMLLFNKIKRENARDIIAKVNIPQLQDNYAEGNNEFPLDIKFPNMNELTQFLTEEFDNTNGMRPAIQLFEDIVVSKISDIIMDGFAKVMNPETFSTEEILISKGDTIRIIFDETLQTVRLEVKVKSDEEKKDEYFGDVTCKEGKAIVEGLSSLIEKKEEDITMDELENILEVKPDNLAENIDGFLPRTVFEDIDMAEELMLSDFTPEEITSGLKGVLDEIDLKLQETAPGLEEDARKSIAQSVKNLAEELKKGVLDQVTRANTKFGTFDAQEEDDMDKADEIIEQANKEKELKLSYNISPEELIVEANAPFYLMKDMEEAWNHNFSHGLTDQNEVRQDGSYDVMLAFIRTAMNNLEAKIAYEKKDQTVKVRMSIPLENYVSSGEEPVLAETEQEPSVPSRLEPEEEIVPSITVNGIEIKRGDRIKINRGRKTLLVLDINANEEIRLLTLDNENKPPVWFPKYQITDISFIAIVERIGNDLYAGEIVRFRDYEGNMSYGVIVGKNSDESAYQIVSFRTVGDSQLFSGYGCYIYVSLASERIERIDDDEILDKWTELREPIETIGIFPRPEEGTVSGTDIPGPDVRPARDFGNRLVGLFEDEQNKNLVRKALDNREPRDIREQNLLFLWGIMMGQTISGKFDWSRHQGEVESLFSVATDLFPQNSASFKRIEMVRDVLLVKETDEISSLQEDRSSLESMDESSSTAMEILEDYEPLPGERIYSKFEKAIRDGLVREDVPTGARLGDYFRIGDNVIFFNEDQGKGDSGWFRAKVEEVGIVGRRPYVRIRFLDQPRLDLDKIQEIIPGTARVRGTVDLSVNDQFVWKWNPEKGRFSGDEDETRRPDVTPSVNIKGVEVRRGDILELEGNDNVPDANSYLVLDVSADGMKKIIQLQGWNGIDETIKPVWVREDDITSIRQVAPRADASYPFNPGDKVKMKAPCPPGDGNWHFGTITVAGGGMYQILTYKKSHNNLSCWQGRGWSVGYSTTDQMQLAKVTDDEIVAGWESEEDDEGQADQENFPSLPEGVSAIDLDEENIPYGVLRDELPHRRGEDYFKTGNRVIVWMGGTWEIGVVESVDPDRDRVGIFLINADQSISGDIRSKFVWKWNRGAGDLDAMRFSAFSPEPGENQPVLRGRRAAERRQEQAEFDPNEIRSYSINQLERMSKPNQRRYEGYIAPRLKNIIGGIGSSDNKERAVKMLYELWKETGSDITEEILREIGSAISHLGLDTIQRNPDMWDEFKVSIGSAIREEWSNLYNIGRMHKKFRKEFDYVIVPLLKGIVARGYGADVKEKAVIILKDMWKPGSEIEESEEAKEALQEIGSAISKLGLDIIQRNPDMWDEFEGSIVAAIREEWDSLSWISKMTKNFRVHFQDVIVPILIRTHKNSRSGRDILTNFADEIGNDEAKTYLAGTTNSKSVPGSDELTQEQADVIWNSILRDQVGYFRLSSYSGYSEVYKKVINFINEQEIFSVMAGDNLTAKDVIEKYFSDILIVENIKAKGEVKGSSVGYLPYESSFFHFDKKRIAAFHLQDTIEADIQNPGQYLAVMREDLFRWFNYFMNVYQDDVEKQRLITAGFALLLVHETGEAIGFSHPEMARIEGETANKMGLEKSPLDMFLEMIDFSREQEQAKITVLEQNNLLSKEHRSLPENKMLVINQHIIENFEGVQQQIDRLLSLGYKIIIEMDVRLSGDSQEKFILRHGLTRYLGDNFKIINKTATLRDISAGINQDVAIACDIIYIAVEENIGLKDITQIITGTEAIRNNPFFPVLRFAVKFLENPDFDPQGIFAKRNGNIIFLHIEKIQISEEFKKWLKQETSVAIAA
ncbi:MAG: AAA family ATPase [Candidatus Omnitrophota bacterium]